MIIMEITNKNTGKLEVEYFNTFSEAKARAIRLAGYAGFLEFMKDRDGDSHAENHRYCIDLLVA